MRQVKQLKVDQKVQVYRRSRRAQRSERKAAHQRITDAPPVESFQQVLEDTLELHARILAETGRKRGQPRLRLPFPGGYFARARFSVIRAISGRQRKRSGRMLVPTPRVTYICALIP